MTKLPVILSIPHGGTKKPEELDGHLCITNKDLFDDTDPFVIELYDLNDKVERVIKTDIARAFVDLNRSQQDMPPENPDGLIKSSTCYQKPIYFEGKEPDESLRTVLLELYYFPYHRTIQQCMQELDVKLCLDCHSMASTAPNISPDGNNKKRPLFCLSNQDGKTCSDEMIHLLADCISECYEIDRDAISINDPFHGGYITKTYGNNPLPWIQVEMNRDLYLADPWFDETQLTVDPSRLEELNKKFEETLNLFFSKLSLNQNSQNKETSNSPRKKKTFSSTSQDKPDYQTKVIVLKPHVDRDEIDELVDSKKTGYFRHLFSKPEKSEIHVHSVILTYEPFMIVSGTYDADFTRSAEHSIKVDHNVKEIFLGDGIFPISDKSALITKLGGKHGKNKIDLQVDEHVFVSESKQITLDHHGTERSFPYKLDSVPKENYPKQVLGKNSVKEFEITTEYAVQILKEKLQENSFDYEVKDLNENLTVDEILEVYVPIYEARLVGPKKKVQIMRIDAVKNKTL